MPNKYLSRSAVFTWTPKGIAIEGLLAGSAAQHVDSSFNATSSLDFCALADVLAAKSIDVRPALTLNIEERFNCLVWSPFSSAEHKNGLIFGGGENGAVTVFNGDRFGHEPVQNLIIGRSQVHNGHVLGLDVNPLNAKLLCSGSGLGQVYIWDLHSPMQPMSPGTATSDTQVVSIRWNRCVEQIMASLCSQRCSVWDLRRPGGPIMSVGDLARINWRHLDWSPDVSTMLAIASEDDNSPIVELWDLRNTASYIRQSRFHQRGIVSMDWCESDGRLLVTAGKDGRILVEDPESGHLIGEVDGGSGRSWARQVRFCPTSPNVIAISSVDERITFHSLDGSTNFETANEMGHMPAPSVNLQSFVPKWQRRGGAGVHFAFGSKMVTFAQYSTPTENGDQRFSVVEIKKLDGESELCQKAQTLQEAIDSNQIGAFCEDSAHSSSNPDVQLLWTYLSALCLNSRRSEFFNLQKKDVDQALIDDALGSDYRFVLDEATSQIDRRESVDLDGEIAALTMNGEMSSNQPLKIDDDNKHEDAVLLSLLANDPDAAVLFCVQRKKWASAFQLLDIANPGLHKFVISEYRKETISPIDRLISLVSTDEWIQIINCWPLNDWNRLFGLLLARAPGEKLRHLCGILSKRMLEAGCGLSSSLPAVVSSDVELLLQSTEGLSLQDRISQAMVVRTSVGGGSGRTVAAGMQFERLLLQYCNQLVQNGRLDLALRVIHTVPVQTKELVELHHRLFEACGGRDQRSRDIPPDPFQAERSRFAVSRQSSVSYSPDSRPRAFAAMPIQPATQQTPYSPAPPLQSYQSPYHQQSPLPPYPSQYQPQPLAAMNLPPQRIPQTPPVPSTPPIHPYTNTSINPVPSTPPIHAFTNASINPLVSKANYSYQPTFSSVMPTSIPSGSAFINGNPINVPRQDSNVTGWNDPPVMSARPKDVHQPVTAQISWQPAGLGISELRGLPQGHQAVTPVSSLASSNGMVQQQPVPVQLNDEDNQLVGAFRTMSSALLNVIAAQAIRRRIEESMAKIESELVPRLSSNQISSGTRGRLTAMAQCVERWDYAGALCQHRDMVAHCDMAEISAFMPALKALLTSAVQASSQR